MATPTLSTVNTIQMTKIRPRFPLVSSELRDIESLALFIFQNLYRHGQGPSYCQQDSGHDQGDKAQTYQDSDPKGKSDYSCDLTLHFRE